MSTLCKKNWCCPFVLVILLAAFFQVSPAPAEDDFTVVLLPDTQYYSEYEPTWYTAQTQWIVDNAQTENIKFVAHLGDIVDNWNATTQWNNASTAQTILENNAIPHSVLPGNHDVLAYSDGTRNYSYYDAYFPRSRYNGQTWFGGTYDSTNRNNYNFFSAGGMDFMVLSLEPLPSYSVMSWANNVVASHPNHRVILATHIYMDPDGERRVESNYGNFVGNDGHDIYNQLVYNNPNIFLTASGHISYEALLPSKNAAGNQVYDLLADYQRTDRGNGWLRLLRFSPDNNTITVSSYSPTLDESNRFHSFTLEYDMGGTSSTPQTRPLATLAARWEFETDGTDSVGDNDLSLTAGASIVTGRFGNGLSLGGASTDYAYTTLNTADLAVSDTFSMATWVKYDSSNSRLARIFNIMEDDYNGCNLGFTMGDEASSELVVRVLKDDVIYNAVTEETIDRDTFHHIAFSFDDEAGTTACQKIKIWIDGEEATLSEANHRDGVRGFDNYFVLGRTDDTLIDLIDPFDWPDAYYSGTLDETRWYDGVLSESQVAALQSMPVPGDADGDGDVDSDDAAALADHWGDSTTRGATEGDFNGDHVVNALDASILAANWTGAIHEGTSTVPEPSSFVMLLAMFFVFTFRNTSPRRRLGR